MIIWALIVIEKHWEYNQPLFIAFLYLEKTFDRVPIEKLWMAMVEYMVPADIQIAIKSTYKTKKSRVSTDIGTGEWFTTDTIRCSPRKHTIIYIVRNVHGLGDQGSTSKQPRK